MEKTRYLLAIIFAIIIVSPFPGVAQQSKNPAQPSVSSQDDASKEFSKLIGMWTRKQGGYGLKIIKIESNGNMEVGYYNPHSVNVSESKAKIENGKVHIFVKLQDAGYPGSYYQLIYEKEQDILKGTYFHAKSGRTLQIHFVRGGW